MQNTFRYLLVLLLFVAACSTGNHISAKLDRPSPLQQPLSVFVGAMTQDNCDATVGDLRAYLQTLDPRQHSMNRELQEHLFQMRLNIKNIYAEGVQEETAKRCWDRAKQALTDLRALEEMLGFQMQNPVQARALASTSAGQSSIFTDSHRQLVSNKQREDGVSSLMDLQTADILLLHRSGSQPLLEQSGSDWTDVVVVYRDAEGELYLFTAEDSKVRRRGWWQSNDWIKRNVNRMQVLRPVRAPSGAVVERLQNRSLRNPYAFGDLIKKEFKLKSAQTTLSVVGDVVLGLDLELSPDLVTLSEWKDYSAAHTSRVLSQNGLMSLPQAQLRETASLPHVLPQFFYNHPASIYQGQKKTHFDERINRGVTSH